MNGGVAQPLSVSQLLDEALKTARRHFRRMYLPIAIPLALGSALLPLAQVVFFRSFGLFTPGAAPDFTRMIPAAIGFGAMLLAAVIVMILGNGALMVGAAHAVAGREVAMAEAWRTIVRPRVLGTLLLGSLVTVAGLFCCVVPGIYAMLVLAPVVAVMTEEHVYGTTALARSRELMGYNPLGGLGNHPCFKAFLVLFVGALLGYALSFIVQLPIMIVQQVVMFRGISAGKTPDPMEMMSLMAWISVPSQMLGMFVQTGVQLYTAFGLALIYFDVRRQKEGGDLESAIRSLAPSDAAVLPEPFDGR